jgi:hypothetical protein
MPVGGRFDRGMSSVDGPYRLIVLDVDGTLVDRERRISPEMLRGLSAVAAFGWMPIRLQSGARGLLAQRGGQRMRRIWVVVVALAWVVLATDARADTVYLTNGESIWGREAYEEGDWVVIVRPGGDLRIPRSQVSRIERIHSTLPPFYSPPQTAPAGEASTRAIGPAGAPGTPGTPGTPAQAGVPAPPGPPGGELAPPPPPGGTPTQLPPPPPPPSPGR